MSVNERYAQMKARDFTIVIDTAMRECGVITKKKAEQLLDAFLQWFALVPEVQEGMSLQMLRLVDRMWHAMILNTAFYASFCDDFAGRFIDHDPLDVGDNNAPKREYADHTLVLLGQAYGDGINPALLQLNEKATCCYFLSCKRRQKVQ